LFAVAAGEFEGFADGAFLEAFEACAGEGAGGAGGVGVGIGIVADGDLCGDVSDVDGELALGRRGGVAGGHDDGVLDDVEELADVAGPVVGGEAHHGGVGDVGRWSGEVGGEACGGVANDARDVFAAVAQRREFDVGAFDAEVEVLSEAAGGDFVFEVFVGGADEADVDLARFIGADADDLAVFEDAEELGLHGEWHVAEFVEEERAAVGVFEDALSFAIGAGEGAFGVAEEFAFEEAFALSGAVEGDEALVGAF